jgi:hypothetical protein
MVQTPDAADIASVSFIRLSSVTHAVDMDQRYIPLNFTRTVDRLTVQTPANANIAPTGYYMLFLVILSGRKRLCPDAPARLHVGTGGRVGRCALRGPGGTARERHRGRGPLGDEAPSSLSQLHDDAQEP